MNRKMKLLWSSAATGQKLQLQRQICWWNIAVLDIRVAHINLHLDLIHLPPFGLMTSKSPRTQPRSPPPNTQCALHVRPIKQLTQFKFIPLVSPNGCFEIYEVRHLWRFAFFLECNFFFFFYSFLCHFAGSPRFDRPYRTTWWARREGRQRSARAPRFTRWQGRQCK